MNIKNVKKLGEAMLQNPHSAISHNLMGILMEKENNHVLAMKHFRAAYALDPTYIPARYNMELYGTIDIAIAVDDFEDVLLLEEELKKQGFYYRPKVDLGEQLLFASA